MKKIIVILVIVSVLVNLNYVNGSEKNNEHTKIYTVFLSKGYVGPGGSVKNPLTNEEVLDKLQNEYGEIDFIVKDITKTNISDESVLNELNNSIGSLDGALIFGSLAHHDYRLAFSGLPTIVVYNLWEWDMSPYMLFGTGEKEKSILVGGSDPETYKKGKILTAQLDRRQVCDPSKSAAMFKDLVDKIKLIQVIKKLKESRILSVAPQDYIAQVDYQGEKNAHLPQDYNETYMREVNELFGVEIVRVKPKEFYEAYQKTDKSEAERIAEKWIKEAAGVEAAESEIIRTARAYLAYEELRKKYNCNAISTHMRSLTGSGKVEDKFWPGLALEVGFKTRGIQAVCQDYPNILIAQLLGYFMTGRPSMLGDNMYDIENSVEIVTHCGAPINPYGDERRVPYFITTHAESPVRDTKKPGSSTGLRVEFPVDVPVTIWKVYPLLKKIGLHTGTTVDGHTLYKGLDDIMCRSKIIAKINAKEVQKHFYSEAYGIHRTVTYGDLREDIKNLAVLLGFNVMEEDR